MWPVDRAGALAGDTAKLLEIYDRSIYPEPESDIAYQLLDATALLWRLHLAGVDVRMRAERIAAVWASKTTEPGFYAFNDVHALLAFVMAERTAAIQEILSALDRAASEEVRRSNAAMARDVGLPVARAIVAFADRDFTAAIEGLERVRDRAHHFGGSHAQRDLLTPTLVEAVLRGGRTAVARHYLAERLVQRPASTLGARLLARGI